MQLKKLSLALLTSTSILIPTLNAASGDEIKFSKMKYNENNDRIKIDFSLLDFKKDFGTDYSFSASLAHDAISGGTPVWDSVSNASPVVTGESNDDKCKNTPSLCQNTSNNKDLLSDGEKDMSKYAYKNSQIEDTRKSISLNLIQRTPSRDELSYGLAYSKEEDFKSTEVSFSYLYNLNAARNDTLSLGISIQDNEALHRRDNNKYKSFDVNSLQLSYTKIFTKKFISQFNYFYTKQKGELSNPYQTVIRFFNISKDPFNPVNNYFIAKEKRPGNKISSGLSFDSVYKYNKDTSIHAAYRFYSDDWGIKSNTLTLNSYINIYPKFTLIPLLRYYKQTKADFYKHHDNKDFHFNKTSYATSDERMGAYTGKTYSLGLEYKINKELDVNFVTAQQTQSFGLKMNWNSLSLRYKY